MIIFDLFEDDNNPQRQLTVDQLATISDTALDSAYGYGRSTPGNTFGWQANLKSASFAKQMIDRGETDIEKISDAVHKGWWSVAQKFVDNPDQFSDTEKLRATGKFDKKMADRKAQMVPFNQLTKDQQDIDTVVARAMLQAITGQQGVAEAGEWPDKMSHDDLENMQRNHQKWSEQDTPSRTDPSATVEDFYHEVIRLGPGLGRDLLYFAAEEGDEPRHIVKAARQLYKKIARKAGLNPEIGSSDNNEVFDLMYDWVGKNYSNPGEQGVAEDSTNFKAYRVPELNRSLPGVSTAAQKTSQVMNLKQNQPYVKRLIPSPTGHLQISVDSQMIGQQDGGAIIRGNTVDTSARRAYTKPWSIHIDHDGNIIAQDLGRLNNDELSAIEYNLVTRNRLLQPNQIAHAVAESRVLEEKQQQKKHDHSHQDPLLTYHGKEPNVRKVLARAYKETPGAKNDIEAVFGHIANVDEINRQQQQQIIELAKKLIQAQQNYNQQEKRFQNLTDKLRQQGDRPTVQDIQNAEIAGQIERSPQAVAENTPKMPAGKKLQQRVDRKKAQAKLDRTGLGGLDYDEVQRGLQGILDRTKPRDSNVKEDAEVDRPIPAKSVIHGYTVFWDPRTRTAAITRGGHDAEAALTHVRVGMPLYKNFLNAVTRKIDQLDDELSQGVAEEYKGNIKDTELKNVDPANHNQGEGEFVKNQLHTMKRVITHLDNAIGRGEDLPDWVQSEIAQAVDKIVGVMDYSISSKEQDIEKHTGNNALMKEGANLTNLTPDEIKGIGMMIKDGHDIPTIIRIFDNKPTAQQITAIATANMQQGVAEGASAWHSTLDRNQLATIISRATRHLDSDAAKDNVEGVLSGGALYHTLSQVAPTWTRLDNEFHEEIYQRAPIEELAQAAREIQDWKSGNKKPGVVEAFTPGQNSPYDCGGADSEYGRRYNPHKVVNNDTILLTDPAERAEYRRGWDEQERMGGAQNEFRESDESQMYQVCADGKCTGALYPDMAKKLKASAESTGKYKSVEIRPYTELNEVSGYLAQEPKPLTYPQRIRRLVTLYQAKPAVLGTLAREKGADSDEQIAFDYIRTRKLRPEPVAGSANVNWNDVVRGITTQPTLHGQDLLNAAATELKKMGYGTTPDTRDLMNSVINGAPEMHRQLQSAYDKKIAKTRELAEDQDTEGVERAILHRIMVGHKDLLLQYGPQRVMQAVEEVAYNVGDIDEIGTSDVSAWVHQVKQILGAVAEAKAVKTRLDPACWTGKRIGTPKTKVKGGVRVNNCVPK